MGLAEYFKKQDSISKLTIAIIAFAIFLRFAIASYTIEGADPCYHASASKFVGENLRFPLFEYIGREIFAHEPLFHAIGGFFYIMFNFAGSGDLGIHMVSPLFGGATIILTFLVARKLFDKYIALFSVLFVSFLPLHIYHSTTTHIDMAGAFFALLSVYLLLNNRFYFSSLAFGFSMLGRINSIFMAPLLAYILFKRFRKKKAFSRIFVFFIIGFLVASPWYIRNYALLHNPVWPFLNSSFGGYYQSGHDLKPDKTAHLLDFKDAYLEVHLALFGVPDGKYENLFLFKQALFKASIALWLVFTLIALLPFLLIFKKEHFRNRNFQLMLWGLLSYLFFLYFYQFNYANTSTRYILPAIPFLGVLWALGVKRLAHINKPAAVFFLVSFVLIFSISEAVKSAIITHQWKTLDNDFEWAKKNTKGDSLFIVPGQCLGYRLDRQSFPAKGTGYNLNPSLEPPVEKIGYIFDVSGIAQAPIPEEAMQSYMPYFQKIYENNQTNVRIYKRK